MSEKKDDVLFRGNKSNLREVLTVFDVKDLNEARSTGDFCIVRIIKKNPDLVLSQMLLRNRKSGDYALTKSRKVYGSHGRGLIETYHESEWELIHTVEGYARAIRHKGDWGAYVVPSDAKLGERFFIRCLIEDLLANRFWEMVTAAEEAEAVWDGSDLVIDHKSYSYALVG